MNMSQPGKRKLIRISIIEDSEIHREWLKLVLSDNQDIQIVSIDSSGKSGITSVKSHNPDLVLLDFQLEDMTGMEVSKRIKSYADNINIFMLTAHSNVSIIERIINDKNVNAVAVKGSPYFELNFMSAIRLVANGGTYLEPSILTKLRQSKNKSGLAELTKREFEVFIQLSMEKTDQKIADDLCVEAAHVKNMKSRILKKIKGDDLNSLISKLLENSYGNSVENYL